MSESPQIPAALISPADNRGTAFTTEQRHTLGLSGRLPSGVLTLEEQAARLWQQLQQLPDDLARNLLLEQMHNRNEVLYYRVLADHLAELLPVVYDPTVGDAIEQYSDEYRGQRGAYLSIDNLDDIEDALTSFGLGPDDVDLVVCSDAEEILGIGDWGVGGIQIAVGKLAIYTAGAGIDPSRTLAVSLDVGTNNEKLLNDPYYVGNRHSRRRGADYDAFIETYVQTVNRLFPKALMHFEDFGPINARAILQKYSPDYCIFNDDVQGTGAVVMAAVYSGLRITKAAMKDQILVVFGAGTAGVGIADQLRDAMVADGATDEAATSQIWLVDKQGLLFTDTDGTRDYQKPYLKDRAALKVAAGATVDLVGAITLASPTILLGTSTVHGGFTQDVVEAMAAATERPMIFPISNPTSRIEAMPADVLAWSNGKALVATGIPVDPVHYDGTDFTIGQANNFLVFPGIGLGVIVSGANRVTTAMLTAAAKSVAQEADPTQKGGALLRDVHNLRALSAQVAEAVYYAAHEDGVATVTRTDLVQAILDATWNPTYAA